MACEDDGHLFWPGVHDEVVRLADSPWRSAQTALTWPCAWCHERVDLVADELARRGRDR